MKIIPIPLSFGLTDTIYETKMGFKTADVNSAVLQFTSDSDPVGCVATLSMKNETDNSNRFSLVLEQMNVTENPFSYTLGDEIGSSGVWIGEITLKKDLVTVCSQEFRFSVGESLQTSIMDVLIQAKSVDEMMVAIQEDVTEHLGKSDASVAKITAYVNGIVAKLLANDNTRTLQERDRVLAELARETDYQSWVEAVQTLIDTAVIDARVQAIIDAYQSTYAQSLFSVTQQLAETVLTADTAAQKADAMASGSPKGVYATLALLQAAYPTGTTGAYLVTADGKWYYWSGSTWVPGGIYQPTALSEDDVYSLMGLPNPEPNTLVTNAVLNGSMELGATTPTNWNYNYSVYAGATLSLSTDAFKVGTKSAKIVADGTSATANNSRIEQTITTVIGHIYYVSAWFKSDVAGKSSLQVDAKTLQTCSLVDTWERKTYYFTATATSHVLKLFGAMSNPSLAVTTYIDGALIIDLTATYGTGYEPTALQMDTILSRAYPDFYFDGPAGIPQVGANNGKFIGVVDNVVKMASFNEIAKADQLPIADTAGIITATNTEDALKELAIGDSYLINNLIKNPLMVDTTDWSKKACAIAAINNELIATGDGTAAEPRIEKLTISNLVAGHTYSIKTYFRAIDAGITKFSTSIFGDTTTGKIAGGSLVNSPTVGTNYVYEYEFTQTNQIGKMKLFFIATFANAAAASGNRFALGKTEVLDLTADFGANNKPLYQHLDTIIDKRAGGIFEGSKVIKHFADKLEGYNVVCFGDSITAGKYPQVLKTLSKANVINCGIGGTRMTGGASTSYRNLSMAALADAYATGVWTAQDTANANLNLAQYNTIKGVDLNTVDYIVLWFGTNDFGGETIIGTNESDNTTFIGAINYIINKLLTAFPHLRIGFISPMWRARFQVGDGLDSDINPNLSGKYLIEYVNALITTCNANHIPVLDMHKNGGVTKYNHVKYLEDGLHPNSSGEILVAQKIHKFVENFI